MFLGLDLGTTNVKAVAVDAGGRVVVDGSAAVDRFTTPDGGVEQNIEQIYDAACQAVREALAGTEASKIQAIGVSSQGGAVQLLDADDQPVGRVISWLDGRGKPFDDKLVQEVGEDYLVEHTGCNVSTMTLGQLLRIREKSPDLLERAKQVGFVGDVIVGRLCGRRAHDVTSLSIAMLYNPSLRRADPDLLKRLGIQEKRLPELLPVTTPAGRLGEEAAWHMGLPAGIPVSPVVHDQYAASTGAGSVNEGDVCLGTGTAWVLVANTARLARPVTQKTFVCPHPVAGLVGQLLSMGNGGSALEWAMQLTGRENVSGDQLDDMLEAVSPGSDGLRFWPLLLSIRAAAASLDSGGRLAGIRLAHSANHLLRAVVEGLACELARHLAFFTDAGFPVGRLVMCGAAAASRATPQIVADVTGQPVACVGQPAVSAFGAAVFARALVETATPLGDLARAWAPASRTVKPGEHAAVYRELLRKYLESFDDPSGMKGS